MKYEKVENPEEVANESLKVEARQKEEIAFSMECAAEEGQALFARKALNINPQGAEESAKAHRREADIYAKAAGLTADEIKQIRSAYLHRWQEMIERNHIHHSAILKVKAELGEETSSYDSTLASLDVSHDVAKKKIAELEGRKLASSERKVAPKAHK